MNVGAININCKINSLSQKLANLFVATTALQLSVMWFIFYSLPSTATLPSLTRYVTQPAHSYSAQSNELLSFIVDQFSANVSSAIEDSPLTFQLASSSLSIDQTINLLEGGQKVKVHERKKTVSGTISHSFAESAKSLNLPATIVDDFVDLIGDRINFNRDIQPGDTFSVMFDQKEDSTGKILHVGLLKAASIMNEGKLIAAIRNTDKNGRTSIYDEQGKVAGDHFLRYPVQFTRVTSVFADSRLHPILNVRRPHNGVDFAAPNGTPVRSVAEGVVEQSGYYRGAGNMIKIAHHNGYSTAYLHLSKISSGIKPGSKVSRGQLIGAVGMTGLATGPHLHFSLFKNNKYIDPLSAKLPHILSEKDLAPPKFIQATIQTLMREHRNTMLASNLQANSSHG